jgi:hypothetical protein
VFLLVCVRSKTLCVAKVVVVLFSKGLIILIRSVKPNALTIGVAYGRLVSKQAQVLFFQTTLLWKARRKSVRSTLVNQCIIR